MDSSAVALPRKKLPIGIQNLAALGLPRPTDIDADDTADDLADDLADLIEQAHLTRGEAVVVLVDEYDKPILDNLTHPAVAAEMRDGLRNLYSVLKGADPYLKFVFPTEKYLGQGGAVHLIGVEFSRTARNVVGFEVMTVTG